MVEIVARHDHNCDHSKQVQARSCECLQDVRAAIPTPDQSRAMAEIVARHEVMRYKELEEARWQVCFSVHLHVCNVK